jgi:hypothetical protein
MEVVVQLTAQQEQALRAAADRCWPGMPLEVQLANALADQCLEADGCPDEDAP